MYLYLTLSPYYTFSIKLDQDQDYTIENTIMFKEILKFSVFCSLIVIINILAIYKIIYFNQKPFALRN